MRSWVHLAPATLAPTIHSRSLIRPRYASPAKQCMHAKKEVDKFKTNSLRTLTTEAKQHPLQSLQLPTKKSAYCDASGNKVEKTGRNVD